VSPFVVAHRAGNQLDLLHRAELLDVALVEADVRLYRGRLEVRHLKTAGPLPFLWDRWTVRALWRPRLELRGLLAATRDTTELMLDLKGPRRALGERVAAELAPYLGRREFTVCARNPRLLEPFADAPVRRVRSVGSRRQLRRLLDRFSGAQLDGVAVHERLLDERVVAELKQVARIVMTWPVNAPERARELVRLGVDGLISDDAEGIAATASATVPA
jgi:glycerophosphoryl diester phosphodiesterase